jgi:hypothetical protein
VLNKEEKQAAGNYDAIIVLWSKVTISKRHKRKLIEQLRDET